MMDAVRVEDDLRSLVGTHLESGPSAETSEGRVRYRLDSILGEGGTSVAFLAARCTEAGEAPHVVKVFKPSLVLRAPEIAEVSRRKEQGAMRRLNDRIPPSPYVVRMTDSGELAATWKERPLVLPWLAMEHINGGLEGTTLADRLTRAVEATGVGFDAPRLLRLLTCVVEGLTVIHELGMIHRDIKPENVLLCGFGNTETAKITDFGVARAAGIDATFGPQPVGTIGYAAPEQLGLLQAAPSPATDVFSLGVLLYRVMTADEYFRKLQFAQLALRRDDGPDPRPHIRDCARLHPDIARNIGVVEQIDRAIRKATSVDPLLRYQDARSFMADLEPALRSVQDPAAARGRRSATRQRLRTLMLETTTRTAWSVRRKPGGDRIFRSIAFEPDGKALAVARDRLCFWDGNNWFDVPTPGRLPEGTLHFALRLGAGKFLVGGQGGVLFELGQDGWSEVLPASDPSLSFHRATGNLDDSPLLLAATHEGEEALYVCAEQDWKPTLLIPDARAINGLAQLDETRWVLVGRSQHGGPYIGIYDITTHAITPFVSTNAVALLAVAGDVDDGVAYAVGPQGLAVAIRANDRDVSIELEPSSTERDMSAVAVDTTGTAWAVAQGRVMKRVSISGGHPRWEAMHNFDWLVPCVGIQAAGSIQIAAVDGAIIEGRDIRKLTADGSGGFEIGVKPPWG